MPSTLLAEMGSSLSQGSPGGVSSPQGQPSSASSELGLQMHAAALAFHAALWFKLKHSRVHGVLVCFLLL